MKKIISERKWCVTHSITGEVLSWVGQNESGLCLVADQAKAYDFPETLRTDQFITICQIAKAKYGERVTITFVRGLDSIH